jgi:hypothetical protein
VFHILYNLVHNAIEHAGKGATASDRLELRVEIHAKEILLQDMLLD